MSTTKTSTIETPGSGYRQEWPSVPGPVRRAVDAIARRGFTPAEMKVLKNALTRERQQDIRERAEGLR